MTLAVLPFNAAQGTKDALARQIPNTCCETVRQIAEVDINSVSYLQQIDDEGVQRAIYVNLSDTLLEDQWIKDIFKQSNVDRLMDGLLKIDDDQNFTINVRVHERDGETPLLDEKWEFGISELYPHLKKLTTIIADNSGAEGFSTDDMDFGSEDPKLFLKFLEGFDALLYIQQANGQVIRGFDPQPTIDSLMEAFEADKNFDKAYDILVQFCRACAMYQLGTFEQVKETLEKLAKVDPKNYKAFYSLGELFAQVGNFMEAADNYERAAALEVDEPAILIRLGQAQMQMGMPVNAERNFRKAIPLEKGEKAAPQFLAQVLAQSGRGHEIPAMWKELIDQDEQNGFAHAQYALSLFQNGQAEEAEKAFDKGILQVEDNVIVKRYYAPVLRQKGDLDRAMDFYEDCIDFAPTDVPLLLEYAQTLGEADREFEIPAVLTTVLKTNPDPNTRAQTAAWLIELEQPKRVENVQGAQKKMEDGDVEGGLRDLRALRTWLADYWKLWALLSTGYNRTGQFAEAEESAKRLLEIFPGCEPGYGELMQAVSKQEGREEEAFNMMRIAASNMPQSLPVHINLALAANRAGHVEDAKNLKRQIREAVGENPELENALAEIQD